MPVDPQGRWFDTAAPIRVDGGLAVRARRGAIGTRWWSRRFVDVLERACDPGRLARGRAYARRGQVIGFELTPGRVAGRVQGSRPQPYEVTLDVDAWDAARWETACAELAARALYRAALLAGDLPPEIVDVFAALGLPLFPDAVRVRCSCPDWGEPCKHASALLYVLAEAFDDDPFLVLAWRGMARADLLAALRARPAPDAAPGGAPADEPLGSRVADYFSPGLPLARLRDRPRPVAAPPELLLRTLDPPPVRVRHVPLVDLLRPAYRALGEADGPPAT